MSDERVWRHPLFWLLLVFSALSVVSGLLLPAFEAMDEPEHFHFIRYLAEYGQAPDHHDDELAEVYGFGQESTQAPLYHWLASLAVRALGMDIDDAKELTEPNPLSSCGSRGETHSKGLWIRHPHREAWPYRGSALAVHALRLLGTAFGALTIAGVYATAQAAFPRERGIRMLAAVLVGLNPRYILHSATITNDVLIAPLAAWGIFLSLRTLQMGFTWRRSILLGLVIGLASLTKVGGFLLLLMAGLAALRAAWRSRAWARSVAHLVPIALLPLLIAGWWYIGNSIHYGDPLLVSTMVRRVGARESWPTHLLLPEALNFLQSYWSHTTYCEIPLGILPIYAGLSVLGAVGLPIRLSRAWRRDWRPIAFLGVWFVAILASWVRLNSVVWAPEGRYLFQAHAAIAPLLAAGLYTLVRRWPGIWQGIVGLLGILALAMPVVWLGPLFTPPPRVPAAEVKIPRPLSATFGDQIRLLGYDISRESVRAGESVDITLFLTSQEPTAEQAYLVLQLVSAAPRDDTMLLSVRTWPGGGNYPTVAWRSDEVLLDRYRLTIPADVDELQLWDVRLIFRQPNQDDEEDRLLPVKIEGVEGNSYVNLQRLRVEPATPPRPPSTSLLDPTPIFGDQGEVGLAAARTSIEENAVHVELWWQVNDALHESYTVFAVLLDGDWQGPYSFVVTSRGCPGGCLFCIKHVTYQNSVRVRSPEHVLEELRVLRDLGIRDVNMYADLFTVSREQVVGICEGILEAGLDLRWTCNSRVDHVDEDLLGLMARAGCWTISWGLESGSERILRRARKGISLAQAERALRWADAAGIMNWGYFIIGLPGETEESIQDTIRFAKAMPIDIALFHIAAPYPGTPFHQEVVANGWTHSDVDWESVDMDRSTVLEYPDMTGEQLVYWQRRAFLAWALRPGPIWTLIKSINSWSSLRAVMRIGLETLGWM